MPILVVRIEMNNSERDAMRPRSVPLKMFTAGAHNIHLIRGGECLYELVKENTSQAQLL